MSDPEIKTTSSGPGKSPVRRFLVQPLTGSVQNSSPEKLQLADIKRVLRPDIKVEDKKHADRDRSPVRRRVFPVVQEVQERRRIALQQQEEKAAIARVVRVNQQEAEVKEWIETIYAQGKGIYFNLKDRTFVESEVVEQLRADGYKVEQNHETIRFD